MLTRSSVPWMNATQFGIDNYPNADKMAAGSLYDIFAPESPAYFRYSTGKWNSATGIGMPAGTRQS